MRTDPRQTLFCFYISATHWDREWYLPFQFFRSHLNETVKEILTVLETQPDFTAFILDGQTVPLEDHLQICPEDEPRIRRLLAENRLVVGPWYTMPDELLVSGESLIRNLRMGKDTARKYGAKSTLPIGYVCDCFGHTAQLPQILQGFDIHSAILGRGTNNASCPAFFRWQAPDGSECTAYKVPESCGYGTFWQDVFLPGGSLSEWTTRAVEYIQREQHRTDLPIAVLMDGMDHTPIHRQAPELCRELEKKLKCKVVLGDAHAYLEQLDRHAASLPVRRGGLQEPAQALEEHNRLISGTLSSRYDLKKANDTVQDKLENVSLPLACAAALQGAQVPAGYEETAYRYLLKNHAHDSICGCSVDEVHRDMQYRFRQADQLSDIIRDLALEHLSVPAPEPSRTFTLFNPHPWPVSGVFNADIALEKAFPCHWDECIPSEPVAQFTLQTDSGEPVPYQIVSIKKDSWHRPLRGFYSSEKDVYRIRMQGTLPPMGSQTYTIVPSSTPVRTFASLKRGPLCAQNEYLRLALSPTGQICLTDLHTGHHADNLLSLLDTGETGDGWTFRPPIPDRRIQGICTGIETLEDGPLACVFRLSYRMELPKCMSYTRHATIRSDTLIPFNIRVTLSLIRGQRYLPLHIEVLNTVLDHRLLLQVQTALPTATYTAEQAFYLEERPCGRDPRTESWKEADRPEKSFSHLVYRRRRDGVGLAVLSGGGLHECAAGNDPEGSLTFTLMRCFGKTFLTDGQPDGQLQGPQSFDLAILPLSADTSAASLLNTRVTFAAPPVCVMGRSACKPVFPDELQLESTSCVISSMQPRQDSILVRCVNYSSAPSDTLLTLPRSITRACFSTLDEDTLDPIPIQEQKLHLHLAPWKIASILLYFDKFPQ